MSDDLVDIGLSKPEPPPKTAEGVAVWDLVVADLLVMYPDRREIADDMRARDAFGLSKYGTRLQANNGRDALVDAYQEGLDKAVYLRQSVEERYDGYVRALYADEINHLVALRAIIEERKRGGK